MVIIDTTNRFTRAIYRIKKAIKKEEYKIRVTVIGSDGMDVSDMEKYIPANTKMIITGLQNHIDILAQDYAKSHSYETMYFLPHYYNDNDNRQELRLKQIEDLVRCGDMVIAFWDGSSEDIKYAVKCSKKWHIPIRVYKKVGQGLELFLKRGLI